MQVSGLVDQVYQNSPSTKLHRYPLFTENKNQMLVKWNQILPSNQQFAVVSSPLPRAGRIKNMGQMRFKKENKQQPTSLPKFPTYWKHSSLLFYCNIGPNIHQTCH